MENSIYLHIPFCVRKCDYCDFLSFGGDLHNEDMREAYVEALINEIRYTPKALGAVSTVYFGGGTPGLLSGEQLCRIMEVLRKEYEIENGAEISMEVNPGTVDLKKLKAFRKAGINRLSIGVQSFRDEELKLLGRIHDSKAAVNCFENAREAGFENINLDLMLHIPGQSPESLGSSLEKIRLLRPEHLSCYSLIIEEGTPFFERYPHRPLDEEAEEKLDDLLKTAVGDLGYKRYEISNYSLPGYECRHNLGCWHRDPYRGYGLGAASLYRDGEGREYRFTGEKELPVYITQNRTPEDPREREAACGDFFDRAEVLSEKDRMEEFMFLGLRCTAGISAPEFYSRFGKTVRSVYGSTLDKYLDCGLLEEEGAFFHLTGRGLDVSNVILADFLL